MKKEKEKEKKPKNKKARLEKEYITENESCKYYLLLQIILFLY